MATVHTELSAIIDAPPAAVYAIFVDYRNMHPQILPKPYFSNYEVEKGGMGAGTIFRTTVTYMGMETNYHMIVTEPEPGRRLVETDTNLDMVTSFIIDPAEGGTKSRVTIGTDWTPKAGVMGWIEKLSTPTVMRKIYDAQLKLVQEFVKKKSQGGGGFV